MLLVLVGLFAAGARALHVDHLGEHLVGIRASLFAALGRPDDGRNAAHLITIDATFARYPATTLVHVLAGAVFVVLAPLQLLPAIRRRHPGWHRWSGRLLLLTGAAAAATGLFFGVLHPFGGAGEAVIIAIAGALFFNAATRAWLAIRRRDTATHREWMLRAFAIMFAVPLTRVIGSPIDFALASTAVDIRTAFVVDLWLSWAIAIGGAEWWIRSRRHARSQLMKEPA